MTTTELIKLLKNYECGASGRSRNISLEIGDELISEPDIIFSSSGDGLAGAELLLKLIPQEDEEIN